MKKKESFIGNYWDQLMATDEGAANYMESYGEGPGCDTRKMVSSFLNDGESVLDVGCGPGWNYEHFKQFGPKISRYQGVDYSMRFIRVASQRVGTPFFYLGDARNLKELDKSWDVVLLQDILEHTNGYEKPIQEALRVARKRVIISFWRGSFLPDNPSEDQMNDDGNDGYGATYNRERFEDYLNSLGLKWDDAVTPEKANRWHKFYLIHQIQLAEK